MGKKSKKASKSTTSESKPVPQSSAIFDPAESKVENQLTDATVSNNNEIDSELVVNEIISEEDKKVNQEVISLINDKSPEEDLQNKVQSATDSETISEKFVKSEGKDKNLELDVETFNRDWEQKLDDLKSQNLQEQKSYQAQVDKLKSELVESEKQRATTADNYQTLVEKVSTIKATLGNKLKSDAAELSRSKQLIVELQEDNNKLHEARQTLTGEFTELNNENNRLSQELSQLRSHFNSSQDGWERERRSQELELEKADAQAKRALGEAKLAKEEAEKARQLSGDLEIAISEEHNIRETYKSRIDELEELLSNETFTVQSLTTERDNALKMKLSLKESYEKQIFDCKHKLEILNNQISQLQSTIAELKLSEGKLKADLETQKSECDVLRGQGNELKEKNLLIGKLRHEAVILNEHLTKALRMIKNNSDGGVVDKQIITNLFLSFLDIPRGDTKKFEVLQLISNFLGWDEEQKAQAGLTRGLNSFSLKSPPNTPSRGTFNGADETVTSAGGFVRRFAEFLERESSREKK